MTKPRKIRPSSITRFEQLFFASLAATTVAIMLNYGTLRSQAIAQGSSPAGPIIGILLTLLINLPLWYFVARRASNVSKWILVVLVAIGTLMLPWTYAAVFAVSMSYTFLSILAYGLSIASTAMLFRRDSVSWLKSGGAVGAINPDIFS
ncbi:MAG: hypothetical protein ACKOPE_13190 [Novosphingobium sp.]